MFQKVDISSIVEIALQAGESIMEIYESDDFCEENKQDNSPLTRADTASHKIISNALTTLFPEVPILSEEGEKIPYTERKNWEYFWCIDPLDGTKEFIKKNGDFTVNIALIYRNTPVLGVIYAPVHKTSFYAVQGQGAYKKTTTEITTLLPKDQQEREWNKIRIVASRSHRGEDLDAYLEKLKQESDKQIDFVSVGSSLKFTIIADGRADMYPRFVPTMEWDTAAGQAILEEIGYTIRIYPSGERLKYNRPNLRNPFFIVS